MVTLLLLSIVAVTLALFAAKAGTANENTNINTIRSGINFFLIAENLQNDYDLLSSYAPFRLVDFAQPGFTPFLFSGCRSGFSASFVMRITYYDVFDIF